MTIRLNGAVRDIPGTMSARELLDALGIDPTMALIEHNERALLRSEWDECVVSEGDRVEILRVAAGG